MQCWLGVITALEWIEEKRLCKSFTELKISTPKPDRNYKLCSSSFRKSVVHILASMNFTWTCMHTPLLISDLTVSIIVCKPFTYLSLICLIQKYPDYDILIFVSVCFLFVLNNKAAHITGRIKLSVAPKSIRHFP